MKKLIFILLPLFAFILLACSFGGYEIAKVEENEPFEEWEWNDESVEWEGLELRTREDINIDACQNKAWESFHRNWINYCEINNIPITIDSETEMQTCQISVELANEFNRQLQKEKEMCITRYK